MISSQITNKEVSKTEIMIFYELHGYNSITLVILYMTNNIYIYAIYTSTYIQSFCITYYNRSAVPAMRSYHSSLF